jgi:cysteine desulfurase family protein
MIYLDSAATTFQKPPSVAAAVRNAMETMSSPGRGGYPAAVRAAETVFACRTELAELFGVNNPEQIVFTMNATHALNLALKSLVSRGDRVVISGYEHNAVTRPLQAIGADIAVARTPLFRSDEAAEVFDHLITPETRAVVCSHVSNVFGFIQPVERIAEICSRRGVPLVVDASQSAGILPLDLQSVKAAFVAMPGHKGLYGPQGTGVLICGENTEVKPLIEGGTGSVSLRQEMPEFLPDRLESGTHNVPGIAGLLEGVRHVRRRGVESICLKERSLTLWLAEELKHLPGLRVFAEPGLRNQTGVLSLVPEGMDVEQAGMKLAENGVAVRCGMHCAPLAHDSAGTLKTGTVRISISDWNTLEECGEFLQIFRKILP